MQKGNTALHIASLAGHEEIVKILVDNGAHVNLQAQVGIIWQFEFLQRTEKHRIINYIYVSREERHYRFVIPIDGI